MDVTPPNKAYLTIKSLLLDAAKKGKTQKIISEETNIPESFISRMKKGSTGITLSHIYALSKSLNLRPCELLPRDWQRAELPTSTNEIKSVTEKVLKACSLATNTTATEPASPTEIASIIAIFIEEEVSNISPEIVRSAIKLSKK